MLKKSNYFGLMEIKWGVEWFNSEANVYTKHWLLRRLCHWYLKLRGFKEVKMREDK